MHAAVHAGQKLDIFPGKHLRLHLLLFYFHLHFSFSFLEGCIARGLKHIAPRIIQAPGI